MWRLAMEHAITQLNLVRAAKPRALAAFARFGEVSGVGITEVDGEYALKINFSSLTTPPEAVPGKWEGVPVLIEWTGRITKRAPITLPPAP